MKRSHVLAIVFWLVVLGTLLIEVGFNYCWASSDAYRFSSLFIFTSVIFFWFLLDARERSVSPSTALKIFVVALSAVALPYYKFRYLGARAGFVFLGIVLFGVTSTVLVAMFVDILVSDVARRC